MSEIAEIAAHRTSRDENDQEVLDRLGAVVFQLYHCIHCDETSEECDYRFKCEQTRQHLDHILSCQTEDCTVECYVYGLILSHINSCNRLRCDLCCYRFDEHPLEYDDTYDEEDDETGGEDETLQQN